MIKRLVKEIKEITEVKKIKSLIGGTLYKNKNQSYTVTPNTNLTDLLSDLKNNYTYIPF